MYSHGHYERPLHKRPVPFSPRRKPGKCKRTGKHRWLTELDAKLSVVCIPYDEIRFCEHCKCWHVHRREKAC